MVIVLVHTVLGYNHLIDDDRIPNDIAAQAISTAMKNSGFNVKMLNVPNPSPQGFPGEYKRYVLEPYTKHLLECAFADLKYAGVDIRSIYVNVGTGVEQMKGELGIYSPLT